MLFDVFIIFCIRLAIEMFKLVIFVCRVFLELAFKLRVGFALVYAMVVVIFFESWARAHLVLAMVILFTLVALGIISWIYTLVQWLKKRKVEKQLIIESMMRNAIHLSHSKDTIM